MATRSQQIEQLEAAHAEAIRRQHIADGAYAANKDPNMHEWYRTKYLLAVDARVAAQQKLDRFLTGTKTP